MGDCYRCGIRRDCAAADGEDDTVVAVRGALLAGSPGLRVCRADCESGTGVAVVSCATRASDGFCIFGTWFGRSGCTAPGELFDSNEWLAPCRGNRRPYAHGSVTSGGNLDYAVDSGNVRPAARWGVLA